MAVDYSETGVVHINGQRATAIKYEVDIDRDGRFKTVHLRFTQGRSEVARASVSAEEARDLLGDANFARLAQQTKHREASPPERLGGELRGRHLNFRQVTLAGYEGPVTENTIAYDSRARRMEYPTAPQDHAGTPHREVSAVGAPDKATASTPPDPAALAEPQPSPTRQILPRPVQTTGVPDHVASKFLRVEDNYYFPDRSLAFVDRGTKLKSESHNVEVVRALVSIAEARSWEAITVTGTQDFRREIWREAAQRGIDVRGYQPSDVEREDLQRRLEKNKNRDERARDSTQPEAQATPAHRETSPIASAPHAEPAAAVPGSRQRHAHAKIEIGELVEHGTAPYKFDVKESESPYLKLQTAQGEKVLWGVDLPRAVTESATGVQIGDVIGVENRGKRRVTVPVPIRDEAGQVLRTEEQEVFRNTWRVEKLDYFTARGEKAAAIRQDTDRQDLVQRHPDLASAAVALWVSKEFAKRIDRPEDQARVVQLVRERLAAAVEAGEPIHAPKLKRDVVARLETMSRGERGGMANDVPGADSYASPRTIAPEPHTTALTR